MAHVLQHFVRVSYTALNKMMYGNVHKICIPYGAKCYCKHIQLQEQDYASPVVGLMMQLEKILYI